MHRPEHRSSLSEVERLFSRALEQSPEQREEFVTRATAGNTDLRDNVLSLLSADARADSFLAAPALSTLYATPPPHTHRVGPFRLTRALGEGGVSVVYLGIRDDGSYQQRVAVKLIKPGMDTAEILRRFHQEQQILARLNHPNIAKLFDAGCTDNGHPYFILEYVEGQPIDEYCASRDLTVTERLSLFRTVCSAVSYAHQNLVVHRDLKPRNILVDRSGTAKLLDFGIAKLLNPELLGGTVEPTATEFRLMTPHYASPEQVLGQPVTTVSDVYSLGVLLYQILTGCRPYDFDSHGPKAIERVVCEMKPPPPSSVARARMGKSRNATLSRDLDVIVLKAMRKEPQRRYASAAELSRDLQRYRSGMPVMARPDTLGYRTSKFVRRHVAGVMAAAIVLVSLIGGSVATFWQARKATAERARADLQRERAEQVSDFLLGLFEVSDPQHPLPEQITARSLLNRGARRIRVELSSQPQTQATFMHTMAVVYHNLGLFQDAATLLQEALDIRESLLGVDHPDVAETLRQLADAKWELAALTEARALYRRALTIREASLGPDDPLTAEAADSLAFSLLEFDPQESEALYRRALDIRRRTLGEDHLDVAKSLKGLAIWHFTYGSPAEAERLTRRALDIQSRALGDEHPEVARTLNNLGLFRLRQGYYDDAEALFGDALGRLQAVLGGSHPEVADLHSNRAVVWRAQGRYDEAEKALRWTLERRRKLRGEHHPAVDNALNHLARVLYLRGKYDEASQHARRALALRRQAYGDEHVSVADSLTVVSLIDLAQGRVQGAEAGFRRAAELSLAVAGERTPYHLEALGGLGATLLARGEKRAAMQLLDQALELRRQTFRPGHPQIAEGLVGLALALLEDEPRAAEPLAREALRIRSRAFAQDDWRVGQAQRILGSCLAARGQRLAAIELWRLAEQKCLSALGTDHPETRAIRALLKAVEIRTAHQIYP